MARIPEIRIEPLPEKCDAVMFDDFDSPIYEGERYVIIDGITYSEETINDMWRLA